MAARTGSRASNRLVLQRECAIPRLRRARAWVRRVGDGEAGVLTTAPVKFMEPTGGSSGALKLVPYTDALLAEFSRATMAWVYDLLASRGALRGGRAYWAVSPPGRRPTRTAGGIAIGMEHDSDYFPAPLRALLERSLAVPGIVARAPDIATCRYLTLRALLAAPDLRLISRLEPELSRAARQRSRYDVRRFAARSGGW